MLWYKTFKTLVHMERINVYKSGTHYTVIIRLFSMCILCTCLVPIGNLSTLLFYTRPRLKFLYRIGPRLITLFSIPKHSAQEIVIQFKQEIYREATAKIVVQIFTKNPVSFLYFHLHFHLSIE